MKKIILSLGALASVVIPTTLAVACGEKSPEAKTNVIAPLTKSEIHNEEGIFLNKNYYNGKLWDGDRFTGKESDKQEIKLSDGYINDSVVEMGDGDSLIVKFNDDNNDGLTPENFEQEFFFNDSSIMIDENITKINQGWGDVQNPFWKATSFSEVPTLVSFKNGKSSAYLGSQSNHVTLTYDEAMANLKNELTDSQYKTVEDYYTHANHGFKPLLHKEGMFTYEKIDSNTFKVTYHYQDGSNKSITAAGFKLINKDKNINKHYWTTSLGDKTEWDAYESSTQKYPFIGRRN